MLARAALESLGDSELSLAYEGVPQPDADAPTLNIQHFRDSVQQLQAVVFPSLHQFPIAVSSNSDLSIFHAGAPPGEIYTRETCQPEYSFSSFGCFVSAGNDDNGTVDQEKKSQLLIQSMFLPDAKPCAAYTTNAVLMPGGEI